MPTPLDPSNNWPTRVGLETLMRAEKWHPWDRCDASCKNTAAGVRPSLTVPAISLNLCTRCLEAYDSLVAAKAVA